MSFLSRKALFFAVGCICCFFVLAPVNAQQLGFPLVKNYSPEDYNAQDQNWAVLQDNRGVMYFGNNVGLIEFNGSRWELIQVPNKSVIRSLAKDGNGRVFAGALGDFGYLKPDAQGNTQFVSLLSKLPESERKFSDVWEIYVLPEGVFYRANNAFFVLKPDQTVQIIKSEPGYHKAYAIGSQLYVRERQKGLCVWNGKSFELLPDGEQFAEERIYGILPYDNNGNLLILSRNKGLFLYDGNKLKPFKTEVDERLLKGQIYTALKIKSNVFAIGTYQAGLFIINEKGNLLAHLDKSKGLRDNTIHDLHIDKNQNLWAALGNGLAYIEINSPFTLMDERMGVVGFLNRTLIHQGKLYVASSLGLMQMPLPKGNEKPSFEVLKGAAGFSTDVCSVDETLLSGHLEGVYVVEQGEIKKNIVLGQSVNSLLQSKKHPEKVWVATQKGLFVLQKQGGQWEVQSTLIENDEFNYLCEDDQGNLWASQEAGGLALITFTDDFKVQKVTPLGKAQGLPADINNHPCWVNEQVWFATENGIFLYEASKGKFSMHPDWAANFKTNKKNIAVKRLVADGKQVWVILENGLLLGKPEAQGWMWDETSFRLIRKANGVFVTQESVFFQTQYGIYVYQREAGANRSKNNSLKAFIYKVIDDHSKADSVFFGGWHVDNKGNIFEKQAKILVLPFAYNAIKVQFGATSFSAPEKTEYQYFLEGFETDWSEWTTQSEKEYTNLREGVYTLRLRARDVNGNISPVETFQFEILPPWYRTWLAYFVYLLFSIGFLFVTARLYGRRLRRQRNELNRKVSERTIELEQKTLQLEAQSTELKDAQLKLQDLLEEETKKKEMLQAQEEELRQNMEELVATQEEMERTQLELDAQLAAINSSSIAKAEYSIAGDLLQVNDSFAALFGMSIAEVIEQRWAIQDLFPKVDTMFFKHAGAHNSENPYQTAQEFTFNNKDGNPVFINAVFVPVRDILGQPRKIIQLAFNITETKELLEAMKKQDGKIRRSQAILERAYEQQREKTELLKAQEEEMRQNMDYLIEVQNQMREAQNELEGQLYAINNSPILKIEFSPQGYVLNANNSFFQLYGYSAHDIGKLHHKMFVSAEFAQSYEYEFFWQQLAEGKSQTGEHLRFNKKGEGIWINAVYTPVRDVEGNIYKIIKLAFDISESRNLINEIKEQNELLGAQEEEMRQNMEELITTQEAMEHKQAELEVAREELEVKNKRMAANEVVLKKAYEKMKEQEVALRQSYEELRAQEEEIRQNMEELQATQEVLREQNIKIDRKNKLITASINYAQNIQQAILPTIDSFNSHFQESFVIFKPKDIVSGDFYWLTNIEEKVLLAVADCTGHGVPGAFMSMIGHSMLNEITANQGITEPGVILELLHQGIRQRLNQTTNENHDGMDVALCSIEKQNQEFHITFAGAKRSLFYIESGLFQEIEGDRFSIGGWQREAERKFTNHRLVLPQGAILYMYSDGFADNPNPNRKKFGEKRLEALLLQNHQLAFDTQKAKLLQELENFQQKAEQRDDITLLGVRL